MHRGLSEGDQQDQVQDPAGQVDPETGRELDHTGQKLGQGHPRAHPQVLRVSRTQGHREAQVRGQAQQHRLQLPRVKGGNSEPVQKRLLLRHTGKLQQTEGGSVRFQVNRGLLQRGMGQTRSGHQGHQTRGSSSQGEQLLHPELRGRSVSVLLVLQQVHHRLDSLRRLRRAHLLQRRVQGVGQPRVPHPGVSDLPVPVGPRG